MEVTAHLEADVLASKLLDDEEFAFDVLAHLADDKRSLKLLPKGNCSSRHHDQVAPFLRQLADAIETAK